MPQLTRDQKQSVLEFVQKYLIQMVNTVFAAIDHPREAVSFLYERLYFAYASEKQTVINNVRWMEKTYQNENTNEFKMKTILKITRPIIKISFLLHGDKAVISLIKFNSFVDIENQNNVQHIINFADDLFSDFIRALFEYKNNAPNNRDEVTEYVSRCMDKIARKVEE
ncbi:MAG: hypothetical protein J0H68_08635 [Sphingobacteriia bacterium]|nr:hypothetical protein [Sphingobacteriia bacterium]